MEARLSATRMLAIALVIALGIGTAAWAQNPTGTLTGRVTNNDGTDLPGVTVIADVARPPGRAVHRHRRQRRLSSSLCCRPAPTP